MSKYLDDVKRYDSNPNEKAVETIVKYLGIALRSRDASLVSCSDDKELDRVRKGFCTKKLGLDAAAADEAVKKVCEQMKGDRNKQRVTFYYLLAKATNTMDKLA
ncbi:DUF2853 family protein [Thermopetrobacter sp. TC1]|uniref:DUF2853 family protein n=1 Tax=Thermopetrobacter sp. TC1 TaxID=1495045 RepID=UPI00056E830B